MKPGIVCQRHNSYVAGALEVSYGLTDRLTSAEAISPRNSPVTTGTSKSSCWWPLGPRISPYIWPEVVPLGVLLKRIPNSAQQRLGKVLPHKLNAERQPVAGLAAR